MAPMTTAVGVPDRAAVLFAEHRRRIFERTDRMFAGLMVLQWFAGVAAALWIAPRTWIGTLSATHPHVWAAVLLGGLISMLPVTLALLRPGRTSTRYVIAVAQMLWSSVLIHLTGGRIETHFHVFGSLAFLAFYRDWRVLVPATIVVAADHFLRGVYWPQSVFGILTSSPWRWVEHAAWVAFEDIFLIYSCRQSVDEMREIASQRAQLEAVNQEIERTVLMRTAELRASREQFRQAFTSAPIGMALVTPQGQWMQVNRALCQMIGYTEEELTATTFQAVTHPDDRADDRAALQQILAGEADVMQREKRYVHKAGHVVWIALSVSSVRDAAGAPCYQIAQIQDITASKQARLDLEQAKEAAEAASSAKSEFLATMSHELRTPLNIILGYVSLMRELEFGPLTTEQSGALERVEKGASELLHLITATLDLGRLEAGRVPVTREWVEPETLLREIDAETRELQEKPGLDVKWEIEPGIASIHTDPAKLKIVLKNLIGNAIKFTDVGQVTISAAHNGRELLLAVRDTGIGIAPEALPIVFEPFRQGDGSPTRRHGGVGLGLYIVARLLDLLGGTLSVESQVDRGSEFVIRIPGEMDQGTDSDCSERLANSA